MDDSSVPKRKDKNRNPKWRETIRPVKKGDPGRNPWGCWGKYGDIKRLSVDAFADIVQAALASDDSALDEIINNPLTPKLKKGVAKSVKNACDDGNWNLINDIISRLIGKVPDKLAIHATNVPFEGLTDEELREEYAKQEAILAATKSNT